MVGHNAAHWSPYDFTPISLTHPTKRRPRHEAPLSYQASTAKTFETNPLPQADASLDPPSIAKDNEREMQPFPVTRKSRRRAQSRMADATRFSSPAYYRARGSSRVPGIGDILGSFKQPEVRPAFKEEPFDEDIMNLPLRKPTPASKRKYEKPRAGAPAAGKPTKASVRRQSHKVTNQNLLQDNEVSGSPSAQRNAIVDLTEDDETGSQAHDRETGVAVQNQNGIPLYGAFAFPQRRDHDEIPETALQQVKEQYRQEHVILPTNVKMWHQLEEFAGRNQNQTRVTPAFLSQIRDFYSTLDLTSRGGGNSPDLQPSFPIHGGPQSRGNRRGFPVQDEGHIFGIQRRSSDNTSPPAPTLNTASVPGIKLEYQTQSPPHASMQRLLRGSANHNPVSRSTLGPQDRDQRQLFSPPHRYESGQSRNHNAPPFGTQATGALTQPSDALFELLPPNTPSGHPHLVSLWDPVLLQLQTEQHNHLNLIDTVVSIIAKYNLKDQSAIKAFLDINECPHFFFLFKSRTSAWHSWSIEREWDIVTIGLERNNRASNTAESTRPSSGQFDITVIFKMDASTPVNTSLVITTDSNPNASTALTTTTAPPALSNVNDNLSTNQAHPPPNTTAKNARTTLPTRSQPTIPGKWNLHGTTIFPAQPSLQKFLWSTPPNRGADDVSRYHHPTQTSLLPASHLSMLARYLQHTAFTCTAMEAEFQVAWGRKVRYDAQLGRVRPTWDYALKGAKTQKEKRKRGEYNVAVGKGSATGGGSGIGSTTPTTKDNGDGTKSDTAKKGGREERPGAGDTLDWLAGRDGVRGVNTTRAEDAEATMQGREKGGRERGRAHPVGSRNGLNGLVVDNATTQTAMEEPPRKRPKRENEDGSGSEYMDSSDEE